MDFVPDGKGFIREFDANRLPKIPEANLATSHLKSKQLVNPYRKKSEIDIEPLDCFSTEQLCPRIRSVSPAQKKNKVKRSRTLGTIQCDIGSGEDSAVLGYTISQDSRTYTLEEKRQEAAMHQVTLEFGALRSSLKYVSCDTSTKQKQAWNSSDGHLQGVRKH